MAQVSSEDGSEVGCERIVDKDNKKRTTNDGDQIVRGRGLRVPRRNPADVHGP